MHAGIKVNPCCWKGHWTAFHRLVFLTTDKHLQSSVLQALCQWIFLKEAGMQNLFLRHNVIKYSEIMRIMMTSSNGNIFCVTGPLCGKFTGLRCISGTKASDVELWSVLLSTPWINGWVNNHEAGDFRRHRAQYDIIVMLHIHYVESLVYINIGINNSTHL